MSKIITLTPKRSARISSKLREAIRLRVEEGATIADACKSAGMSTQGWHKAMKRPDVQSTLSEAQHRFVEGTDAKRALYKARALEVALDLMMNSKSEAIRARMVEFLASDAKVSPVSVHVDARQVQQPMGYVYRRPGEGSQPIEGDGVG
ncbi:hypothetical protein [Fuscibacter oryzae]|uniref:Uncharacterized protein n=1 Tax=Fuscibacter oryzae TaxID=2803939 RepID=A0A8J7ST68_9RHOB|nr:hypothetical protein [Fuscibacter oryzae]MBL4928911.1 hypothetical protein [Fuscibacter oryzae]